MRYFLLFLPLLLVAAAGCSRPVDEEAKTNTEVISRGKFARGYAIFADAAFSEDGYRMVEALRAFRESLTYDPDFSRANAYFAYAMLELLRISPMEGEAIGGVTVSLETALRHARKAVEVNPDSGETRGVLAMALLRAGDLEAAEQQLKAARDRENKDYLVAKGDWLRRNAEFTRHPAKAIAAAVECYLRAKAADPGFGVPYVRLLDVYEFVGDKEGIQGIVLEVKRLGKKISDTRRLRYIAHGLLNGK